MHDPFIALTAAAIATTTIKVGSGVCLITERDPIVTAKEVASLDMLSNGRFLFGIGAGLISHLDTDRLQQTAQILEAILLRPIVNPK